MNLAVENLLSVSFFAVGFFLFVLFLVHILKIFHKAPEFRIIKKKPLLIPAIVFLLVLPVAPRQHIGPPPGMETHAISNDLDSRFETSFEVYEWVPYLPRVRVDYSCLWMGEEKIECTLLISVDDTLVRNITDVIYYSGSPNSPSTVHSTFELEPGFYNLTFTQRVFYADGTPTDDIRDVHVSFYQLQDYEWIEVLMLWDQLKLLLVLAGFGLLLISIYVTDHRFDTPEEYERYQRKMRGERNYPYGRKDRLRE